MTYPILHFREPLDERIAWETVSKGWYDGVTVEIENGSRYPVFFYDPGRLAQDLQSEVQGIEKGWGKPCIAEIGMIVIPELSEANMRIAIQQLYKDGWFDSFKPIPEAPQD